MSEEMREQEGSEAQAPAPSPVGSQLRAAREKKGMSVGDIATALKLGGRQVEALESGDWQRLPGHTFIRGFVRNYARLVQVDPSPLMAQLDAVIEAPQQRLSIVTSTQATMPETGRSHRRDYALAASGFVLVLAALGLYFFLPAEGLNLGERLSSLVASVRGGKEAQAPAQPAAGEPVFPPGTTQQQVMHPQAQSETLQVPPSVVQPDAAASPVAESPALHFVFSQESWVEVRDRTGSVVFSQRNPAGSEKTVDGQPPFAVVVGNAPGVRVSYRGHPVDLVSNTQSNVARFTLE